MSYGKRLKMNNYERIKMMSFDEMLRFVGSRTHCVDCPMNYSKECNKEINKCREKTKQWLLEESDYAPNYTMSFYITTFIFLFFFGLGLASFIDKIFIAFKGV